MNITHLVIEQVSERKQLLWYFHLVDHSITDLLNCFGLEECESIEVLGA